MAMPEASQHPRAPNSLEASASLTPNASSPLTVVMHFFLFRVLRSNTTCGGASRGGSQHGQLASDQPIV